MRIKIARKMREKGLKNAEMFHVEQNISEYDECKTFYEWTQWHPLLKGNVIKIVNEGRRSLHEGKKLKAIGLMKGVPDYCIAVSNNNWHSLWIEMKRVGDNKKHSKEQVEWIDRLLKLGHYATFIAGCDEAIQVTTDYLNNCF